MTVETWPAAGASEDPIRPQWMGNMDDAGMLRADPSSAYDLHATHDPAIRRRWMEDAETERDQHRRAWAIQYRITLFAGDVSSVSTRCPDLTAAQAWARFRATVQAHGRLRDGARLVLLAIPAGVR
jgi:hypothetical protein